MAPEDSTTAPCVRNDGSSSFLWYNWQPLAIPPADTFIPSSVDAASLSIAGGGSKVVNSSSSSGWLMPYPNPAASSPGEFSPHHDAAGGASPHTCSFLHSALEWQTPLVYFSEEGGDTRAEPGDMPQLEDFLGGLRASPPAAGVGMELPGSVLGAGGHCYLDREQGVLVAASVGAGNSSSEVDSRSENSNQLALSGGSSDVVPEIGLTCSSALAVVIPQSGGGARGKPLSKVMAGSGQRSSSYRGVTRHRWTGRYEAHLWDNTCVREGIKRKGRQGN